MAIVLKLAPLLITSVILLVRAPLFLWAKKTSHFCQFSTSFTDFPPPPPDKTTPRNRLFLRRTPEVAPGHNTGYSYAHVHIAQIKM